jgi:hypothetical protein
MIQRRRGTRLIAEPLSELNIAGQTRRQKLESYSPSELCIQRFVDDTHAARAQTIFDYVWSYVQAGF